RVRMRYEFARLHGELKTTMIYVTHDQVEAMTLADRIVVLNGGRIEQVGAPMALYQHPANLFVAGFIGSPKMNLLKAEIVEASREGAVVKTAGGERVRAAVDASTAQPGAAVTLGIRPEHIVLNGGRDSLSAQVLFVETLGAVTMAHLKHPASDETLTVQTPGERRLTIGETVSLSAAPADVHLFDAEGCALPRL
ncbi:MAG: ABC transporter ATP-binding protein, partial [Brevundimonas aurantiaca]